MGKRGRRGLWHGRARDDGNYGYFYAEYYGLDEADDVDRPRRRRSRSSRAASTAGAAWTRPFRTAGERSLAVVNAGLAGAVALIRHPRRLGIAFGSGAAVCAVLLFAVTVMPTGTGGDGRHGSGIGSDAPNAGFDLNQLTGGSGIPLSPKGTAVAGGQGSGAGATGGSEPGGVPGGVQGAFPGTTNDGTSTSGGATPGTGSTSTSTSTAAEGPSSPPGSTPNPEPTPDPTTPSTEPSPDPTTPSPSPSKTCALVNPFPPYNCLVPKLP